MLNSLLVQIPHRLPGGQVVEPSKAKSTSPNAVPITASIDRLVDVV